MLMTKSNLSVLWCMLALIAITGSLVITNSSVSRDVVDRADWKAPSKINEVELSPLLLSESRELTHPLTIYNDTTDTIRLKKPQATCGCTRVSLSKQSIQPGEKSIVSATIKLNEGQDEAKEVDVEVFAESGRKWHFRLKIPVISPLVAPGHVPIPCKHALTKAEGPLGSAVFKIEQRSQIADRLKDQVPKFEYDSQNALVEIVDQKDSEYSVGGEKFWVRKFTVRVDILNSTSQTLQLNVRSGLLQRSVLLNLINVPVVDVVPKRIILSDPISQTDHQFSLTFPQKSFTAKPIRYPDFVAPLESNRLLSSDSPTWKFRIRKGVDISSVSEVVFLVRHSERDIMEVKALLILLPTAHEGGLEKDETSFLGMQNPVFCQARN